MEEAHAANGGTAGNGIAAFKKAVADLIDRGIVRQPAPGFYELVGDKSQGEAEAGVVEAGEPLEAASVGVELVSTNVVIGGGPESVYVYYNETDERLARAEGRDTWDCKIGFTAGNVSVRILGQAPLTSMARLPKVGLVIKTDDAKGLERVLHYMLDEAEARIDDAPGTEWFVTSPKRIADWYDAYSKAVGILKGTSDPA
jgi:hypothetical protein